MGMTDHFSGCCSVEVDFIEVLDLLSPFESDLICLLCGNGLLIVFFLHDMLTLKYIMTASSVVELNGGKNTITIDQ